MAHHDAVQPRPIFEIIIASLAFAVLIAYTFAKFLALPYAGFVFDTTSGELKRVFVEASPDALQVGDRLLQIDDLPYSDYKTSLLMPLLNKSEPGDIVQITIQRDDQTLTVPWTIPGWTQEEFLDRFSTVLLLAYIFWAAGLATLVLVRPRDLRWRLIVIFFFVTSIWLAAGSLSAWHFWGSAVLLRVMIWLWIPITLHLHYVFPQPLRRLPRGIIAGGYALGALLALLQAFQRLPASAYFLGFILAAVGSLILLALHYILRPLERSDIGFLIGATMIALLPLVIISLGSLSGSTSTNMFLGFLAMPALPIGYFRGAFRRQLGGLELRVNRVVSTYLFIILLSIVAILLVPVTNARIGYPIEENFIDVASIILVGLLSAIGYQPFTRLVERRLLGIPLPPTHLVATYAARITTSVRLERLTNLIRDDILPSLVIRQSLLLRVQDHKRLAPLCSVGLDDAQQPQSDDLPALLAQAEADRSRIPGKGFPRRLVWIKVALPLTVEGELIGLWLLGRRDPDDYYAPGEIDILKIIANQTAIALTNIEQTERLHALYQADIEYHETERSNLALDLHDDVLNQLAGLSMKMDAETAAAFEGEFQAVITHLRRMISGLRPAMLSYGLVPALEEMVDEISSRSGDIPQIRLEIASSGARYDGAVEAHLYRIVQQACENALRHAQARTIRIHGECTPESVQLIVEDDGVGFPNPAQLDFNQLLANKHYGVAGMFERAELIGAKMNITSAPQQGTQVSVSWQISAGA